MPYETVTELPDRVKDHLPKHAQEIYKKAFNNAWEEYENPKERRSHESREEVAHKVAWSAVKEQYKKSGDTWTQQE